VKYVYSYIRIGHYVLRMWATIGIREVTWI